MKRFASNRIAILVVFSVACIVRVIPEIVAYPHPVGYDVINYYIPVITNFDSHWKVLVGQFPLYVILLHSISLISGLSPYLTVVASAIAIYGIFSVSIYCITRTILKFGPLHGVFLATGVILQVAILRTTWDLHRDVFALSMMFFALVLFHMNQDRKSMTQKNPVNWKIVFAVSVLVVAASATDRLVGLLCCGTLILYCLVTRSRSVLSPTACAVIVYLVFFSLGQNQWILQNVSDSFIGEQSSISGPDRGAYDQLNLLILFSSFNGLLIAPAIYGFLRLQNSIILKIPFVISLIASFSWLILPRAQSLVADRWIVLSGIFISIFGLYALILVLKRFSRKTAILIGLPVMLYFIVAGLAYEVLPYDKPFILYAASRQYIEHFSPVTMQFNSIDIKDNDKMMSAISWLNHNTEPNSLIVGEKHWRGFMELYLQPNRTYLYSDDPTGLVSSLINNNNNSKYQSAPIYIIMLSNNNNSLDLFTIHKVR